MATRPETVAYLLEVMAGAGGISARKMFGEYAVYLDGKVVARVLRAVAGALPAPGPKASKKG